MTDGQYVWAPPGASSLADLFLFGAGTKYRVGQVDGLLSQPPMEVATAKLTGRHGGLKAGPRTYQPRKVTMEIRCESEVTTECEALLDALQGAFAITEGEGILYSNRRTKTGRALWCHPTRAEFVADYDAWTGTIKGAVEFEALDPLWYDSTFVSLVIRPSGSVAGRTYPLTYPRTYSTPTSGLILGDFFNAGTVESFPKIKIIGPLTTPVVKNQTTNEGITLNVSLAAGQSVEIDMRTHTVMMNNVSIRGLVAVNPKWWGLQPGSNILSVSGAGGTDQSQAIVTGSSAWPNA